MPNGAVISPPDSTQNSSDEDDCSEMRTARELGGPLEEQLKEAIMKIPQRRFPSPERKSPPPIDTSRGRNVTAHHRSRSDSSMLIDIASRTRSGSNSGSVSDFEDDAYRLAPAMIRKKSGEVVKSSLKSPCRSRPCSMPSTPTFPKNVHFDSRIEHVRHFLHSEKPSAVSVGSSPVEGVYDTESEYPFESDEPQWDIVLPNFPKEHESRKALAVRLEKVCLSTDKKNLIGTIAVSNLSFQKHVVTRFTFDYWQTVSEVGAEYSSDVRRKEREDGVDRFVFKIKLAEQANLEKKVLFFCIRYTASGQEHWDNNAGVNFQVDFKRAEKAQRCQQALPRSKPTPLSTRPRSLPTMEDYDELMDKAFFGNSKRMGASERPKPKASSRNLAVEEDATILARRANPTSNAFGNRYSLTAAIKAADTRAPQPAQQPRTELKATETSYFNLSSEAMSPMESPSIGGSGPPEIFATGEFWTVEDSSKPWTSEDKPSIESPSYRELLDNYCFVSF